MIAVHDAIVKFVDENPEVTMLSLMLLLIDEHSVSSDKASSIIGDLELEGRIHRRNDPDGTPHYTTYFP